jgi:hypothetical protein
VTDQAFVHQEILDASLLNPADLRCPRCKGNTLVLTGQAQIPQREIMENGVMTHHTSNAEAGGSFDVERIDCLPCNVTFMVRDPKLFQLERENLNLKHENEELKRTLGEGGSGSGSQNTGIGWLN